MFNRPLAAGGVGRPVFMLFIVGIIALFLHWREGGRLGLPERDLATLTEVELISTPSCDVRQGPCHAVSEDLQVSLQTAPDVKALRPFALQIQVRGHDAAAMQQAWAIFTMQGMQMGENRYRIPLVKGTGQGEIILPVCSSRRTDWTVNIELPVAGTLYQASFTLQVD